MDAEVVTELLVGLAVAVGVVGVLVPVLPGSLLIWVAVLAWALEARDTTAWTTLGIVTAVLGVATLVKYLVPHRRLRAAGVPHTSILLGGLLGVVGFFVVPVVGLPAGFVAGLYVGERRRQQDAGAAWSSTKTSMRLVGLSIVIELAGALVAAVIWFVVAVAT